MKGQQEALSAILITGVMIAIVGSVYFWALPLIQKNKDINTLEATETFMKGLDEKIKGVSNNAGSEQIRITVPGILNFKKGASQGYFELEVMTDGSIYATGSAFPIIGNNCNAEIYGEWGVDNPAMLCITSNKIENRYTTVYNLTYRQINSTKDGRPRNFKIILDGNPQSGGKDHFVNIENENIVQEGNLIKTVISINIV